MIMCSNCEYNDGNLYCSDPPQYKCTKDNTYHFGSYSCYEMRKKNEIDEKNKIQNVHKEYNCPDCKVIGNTCSGCQRYMERPLNALKTNDTEYDKEWLQRILEDTPVVLHPYDIKYPSFGGDYDPCAYCTNNPKNGGSGICNCTIPYFSRTATAGVLGNPTTSYTSYTYSSDNNGDTTVQGTGSKVLKPTDLTKGED